MTFHQFYCLILQVVEERDKLKEENHKMKEFIRTVKQDVSKFTFIDEIDEDRDEKDDDDIPERSDSDKSQTTSPRKSSRSQRKSSVETPGSKSSEDLQEPSDDDSEDEENGKDKKKLSDFEDSLKTQIQENKCTKCNESFHPAYKTITHFATKHGEDIGILNKFLKLSKNQFDCDFESCSESKSSKVGIRQHILKYHL